MSTEPQNPGSAPEYVPAPEWVAGRLRESIATKQYSVGSLLPSERDLSRQLRVPRSQIRHALALLAEEGLVRRSQGRGTEVLAGARDLHQKPIAIVHVRVEDAAPSPELYLVLQGITERLDALGFPHTNFAYFSKPGDAFTRQSSHSLMALADVPRALETCSGAIFIEASEPEVVELALAQQRKAPCVVANLENDTPIAATRVNHADIMRRAVELLVTLGHHRIGFVGRPARCTFYGAALRGFREGMAQARLPVDESLIVMAERTSSLAAYLAVKGTIERPDRPTAVVAARDILASGVWQAVEGAGLKVGYDVSLVGYDNLSWRDHESECPLTTFAEPCRELGAAAADMLVERVRSGARPPEQRELDAPLILRRSTGLVPSGHAPAQSAIAGVCLTATPPAR